MGFRCKWHPVSAQMYLPLERQLPAAYRALLETEALSRAERVTPKTDIPNMPCIMEKAPYEIGSASEASLLKQKWYLQG